MLVSDDKAGAGRLDARRDRLTPPRRTDGTGSRSDAPVGRASRLLTATRVCPLSRWRRGRTGGRQRARLARAGVFRPSTQRGPRMNRIGHLLTGFAAGLGLGYVLSPAGGRRRHARARDRSSPRYTGHVARPASRPATSATGCGVWSRQPDPRVPGSSDRRGLGQARAHHAGDGGVPSARHRRHGRRRAGNASRPDPGRRSPARPATGRRRPRGPKRPRRTRAASGCRHRAGPPRAGRTASGLRSVRVLAAALVADRPAPVGRRRPR
jgi:hypothetical protein